MVNRLYSFYTLAFYLASPLILGRLWWRGRDDIAYRQRIGERFGHYQSKPVAQSIWLHAVSYGEAVAAESLIKQLMTSYPEHTIVITTMTITGSQRITSQFGAQVQHVYIPYDLPAAIRRFIKHFNPKMGILMETELWPNLLKTCEQHNIPMMIANGRLSMRSTRGYARIKPMVNKMVNSLSIIATQSKTDAKRFKLLGANKKSVHVAGNLKNDFTPPQDQIDAGKQLRATINQPRPVWVAASTHEGEEAMVLEAYREIKNTIPDCLLILVPRHPERFDSIFELCSQCDFTVIRRSKQDPIRSETDILLGDTMGEMFIFYAMSDVALVAGSLQPIGGHNLLEPTSVGIPIITGPHLFNTADVNQLFPKDKARREVSNTQELAQAVTTLLQHPEKRVQLVHNAQRRWQANQGALNRHLNLINELIDQRN